MPFISQSLVVLQGKCRGELTATKFKHMKTITPTTLETLSTEQWRQWARLKPLNKLSIEQLRKLMETLDKNHDGMSKDQLQRTLCALIGYKP